MSQNTQKVPSRRPKKRAAKKQVRLEKTLLFSSTAEVMTYEEKMEITKAIALMDIEAYFGQLDALGKPVAPFHILENHLKPISITPEEAGDVIRAADLPMRGHQIVKSGPIKIPKGERWEASSRGVFKIKNGYLHEARYRFGEGGALYQQSRLEGGGGEADHGPSVVVRREPCVSADAAMAAFSALLAEFERLRLAVTNDATKGVRDHLAIVKCETQTLVESLRHPYSRIIGRLVSPAAEAINQMLVIRIEDVLKILQDSDFESPKIELMPALSSCFNFLFEVSTLDAVRAFSRFGSAFFGLVGCPCTPGNFKSQFYLWQRPRRA